jgi:hypothetical protein
MKSLQANVTDLIRLDWQLIIAKIIQVTEFASLLFFRFTKKSKSEQQDVDQNLLTKIRDNDSGVKGYCSSKVKKLRLML